jgi:hypothetical protein
MIRLVVAIVVVLITHSATAEPTSEQAARSLKACIASKSGPYAEVYRLCVAEARASEHPEAR